MENLNILLIVVFVIIWLIEFYLFGMQRASLLISRQNNVEWRGVGEYLLPNWYPVTWLIRILKYGLLIAILIIINWKWAFGLLCLSFIILTITPIPYRFFYKKTFRNKANKIINIDYEAGTFMKEMLEKSGF
jgi:hypothetical protein